jgi:hypothetical protein
VICSSGCKSKDEPAADTGAAAPDKNKSSMPPEARRDSPPEAIATTALTVGSTAPALQNVASTSGAWSRGDKVTALVFYRGHW